MRLLLAMLAVLRFTGPALEAQNAPAAPHAIRNPAWLRAHEVLERREPGHGLRVRFEWEQVAGATSYVLAGRWSDERSWATRSMEVLVTPGTADQWQDDVVVVELLLVPGTHSWSVVAATERSLGDLANPARHTFEIR